MLTLETRDSMDGMDVGNCMVTEVRDWIARPDSCDRAHGLDHGQKMCCASRLLIQDQFVGASLRAYTRLPVMGR